MKAIFGLGNPGKEYEKTRHNVGFLVLDELAKRYEGAFSSKRSLEADIAEVLIEGERVLLVKPQTFMNASGRSLGAVMSKYPVTINDVLVVYDDADLPFGNVRYKESGSSAGHRGMESIIESLPKGTAVARIRVGIGRPTHPDIPLDEFVLGRWTEAEEKALAGVIASAAEAASEAWREAILRKIASSPSSPRNDKGKV
ncbi:aminoacyl-tRNA hydrolase [Candidatus Uhrbacteria bacterium]|nr:aminoacyl-tRNA hydrolase [Candidatus Uhrbacteria bacterium]